MAETRINKYLSEMGICSRREADRLIEEGKILIDGRTAVPGMKISDGQSVICGGKPVGGGGSIPHFPHPVLLAVNKPKGVVCTTSQKDRAINIVELVNYPERVYPVGRLDKDSEGLIFMTNQGELVNQIMRGSGSHEKEYLVAVDKPVTKAFLDKMQAGVFLKELNTITKPCFAEKTREKEFRIILTQGLNRQIRRMCGALGYQVRELKRTRIMNIRLGKLNIGTYRRVSAKEYEELLKLLNDSSESKKE